jgi:hypothetical protein
MRELVEETHVSIITKGNHALLETFKGIQRDSSSPKKLGKSCK